MSSREFAEWVAYYRREPFGDRRGDIQAAHIASIVANCSRDPKQRSEPYTIKDMLIRFAHDADLPDANLEDKIDMSFRALGGH
jgi:hypothetical protein